MTQERSRQIWWFLSFPQNKAYADFYREALMDMLDYVVCLENKLDEIREAVK